MLGPFERAALDGIVLLRGLPTERARVGEARRQLGEFRASHPDVHAELAVDWTSDATRVHYDLLLRDEAHGTLALARTETGRSPWSAQHAEHWAAQRVLTLDGHVLTVHDALRHWQARAALGPSPMDDLLDEVLVARARGNESTEVSVGEAQRAADALRRRLGLGEREHALRWMQAHGLSLSGFEELACEQVRRERWLERNFSDEGAAYFEQHPSQFDRVGVFYAYGEIPVLGELATEHREGGSLPGLVEARLRASPRDALEGAFEHCFAWQLLPELRAAGGTVPETSRRRSEPRRAIDGNVPGSPPLLSTPRNDLALAGSLSRPDRAAT